MSIRHLYPDATEPTEPRFNVGDIVHAPARVCVRGYWFCLNSSWAIEAMAAHLNAEPSEVIVYPSVFGVIVDYPEEGTEIYDCSTAGMRPDEWNGWEDPHAECELDLPDSGSIWFLPDNERRYFVRWANKQPYQYGSPNKEFTPMKSDDGNNVFNISLYPEDELKKAPDFVGKLREIANKRRSDSVECVFQQRLGLDQYTIKGLTNVVCEYS